MRITCARCNRSMLGELKINAVGVHDYYKTCKLCRAYAKEKSQEARDQRAGKSSGT